MRHLLLLGLLSWFIANVAGAAASVTLVREPPPKLSTAAFHIGGRTVAEKSTSGTTYRHQWPGTYSELSFTGSEAFFRLGNAELILHVLVDGELAQDLVKPAAGLYQVAGLDDRAHVLRLETATESQAAPNLFAGFAVAPSSKAGSPKKRARQIEFIGDSHTVGYGNISATTECTTEEVWRTTDTSQAFGPLLAKHYDADYQINAISGRGIVRNYNGFAADPMPVAYPRSLLESSPDYRNSRWHPQLVVISLGTNDLSTPLNEGERWHSREELHTDYETTFVRFVKSLRAKYPRALFILWSTDGVNGEIPSEVNQVFTQLQQSGETRIAYLPVNGLSMSGCHGHPSAADHQLIATRLRGLIDAQQQVWHGK